MHSTRRYIATVNALSISRQQKVPFAEFTVEFICTNPFGLDISPTTITNQTNYTSATLTVTPTIAGSAPYQLPVITITLDSFTGTADYIQISNGSNGQEILLYGLGLEAGNVIVIDCANREVTVDGNPVDYDGVFLELSPGAGSITYTDGYDTRQVDILMTYVKRWL